MLADKYGYWFEPHIELNIHLQRRHFNSRRVGIARRGHTKNWTNEQLDKHTLT